MKLYSTPKNTCARALLVVVLLSGLPLCAAEITVRVSEDSAPVDYALRKLEASLIKHGDQLHRLTPNDSRSVDIVIRTNGPGELGCEGFRFAPVETGGQRMLQVLAGSEQGLMYGLLELADQIRLGTPLRQIKAKEFRAQFKFRAIKFNLPWAAYRASAVIEQHQAVCKDLKFWEAFLDMMAENRFNTLTLWSLHPFALLTVPKSFPEAQSYSDAEMTEFRALFTGIFKLAKQRGIETYLINWNTFVSPAFARAHDVARWSESWDSGGAGTTNPIVIDYTRECVKQVIDEYPDLTGLGVSAGEHMGGQTPDERRSWLQAAFFDGIAQAKRPIKLIYRAPLSANTEPNGTTSGENDRRTRLQIETLTNNIIAPVYVEFKYNWSHGHSSPDLLMVHGGKLSDAYWNPMPTRHEIVWTMRNEDFFVLRWGQPDFVRHFARNQHKNYVGGAMIGSECYIPALDYITAPGPHKTWSYAFERQWLFYAVWGRLLYNSSTADDVFAALLGERFGKNNGDDLLEAWKLASNVPLNFASFHQGSWDGDLYTEGHCSWRGDAGHEYFDIESFIKHPVLDTKRYMNIADFVKSGGQVEPGVVSPIGLADQLDCDCSNAVKLVTAIRRRGEVSPTLDCELTDIEAWCAYGNFFAEKLRGGVALARAWKDNDPKQQAQAVVSLEQALANWKWLAELGGKFNTLPVLSNSKEPFSWALLTPQVERDVETAKVPLIESNAMSSP